MVLHFKKNFLKGSILTEVLAALVMFGLAFAVIAIIRDTNPQHPTPSFFRAGEAHAMRIENDPDSVQSKP